MLISLLQKILFLSFTISALNAYSGVDPRELLDLKKAPESFKIYYEAQDPIKKLSELSAEGVGWAVHMFFNSGEITLISANIDAKQAYYDFMIFARDSGVDFNEPFLKFNDKKTNDEDLRSLYLQV